MALTKVKLIADNAITSAMIDSTSTGVAFADLTVDTSTLVVDAVNNRVGIGVSNPSDYYSTANDLVVGGSSNHGITIATGDTNTGALHFADGTSGTAEYAGYIAYQHNDNKLRFGVNASDKLVIQSSGNVGIGTASPEEQFTVGGTGTQGRIGLNTTGVDHPYIQMAQFGSPNTNVTVRIDAGGDSYFNGGNVGIGETSPLAKLHIKTSSTSNTNQLLLESTDAGASSGPDLALYRNSASPADGDVLGALWFYGNNSTPVQELYSGILSVANDVTDGTEDSEIRFLNMVNGTLQTPMTIDGLNVGIKETDPSGYWGQANDIVIDTSGNGGMTIKSTNTGNGRLVFTDTKSATAGNTDGGMITYNHTDDEMRFQTNGSQKMVIDSSGNVGIGTTSPGAKLDISESNNGILLSRIYNTSTASASGSALRIASSSTTHANSNTIQFSDASYYTATISGDRTQGLVFRTSATGSNPITIPERMRIASNGAIGIGGANYGTSGQVLTSNGSGSAPSWQTAGGGAWGTATFDISTVTTSGTTVATTVNASTVSDKVCGIVRVTFAHANSIAYAHFAIYETSNLWFVTRVVVEDSNSSLDISASGNATNTITIKVLSSSPSTGYDGKAVVEAYPASMFGL